MKVIMVSRTFPVYHPKAGKETNFVEKIYNCLVHENYESIKSDSVTNRIYLKKSKEHEPKRHTVRSGNRWKVGDMASLRYWDGKPYGKGVKPVEFAQVEIKQTWPVKIYSGLDTIHIFIAGCEYMVPYKSLDLIAKNDGLSLPDLRSWFKMPVKETFIGQIICWSDKVSY